MQPSNEILLLILEFLVDGDTKKPVNVNGKWFFKDLYNLVGRSRDHNPNSGEAVPIMFNPQKWLLIWEKTFWYSDTPE